MAKILIGNIKGPKGDTGEQGPQGATGPQGPQGPLPPLVNNALATEAGVAALDAVMGKTLQDQITGNDNDITQLKNDLEIQYGSFTRSSEYLTDNSTFTYQNIGNLSTINFRLYTLKEIPVNATTILIQISSMSACENTYLNLSTPNGLIFPCYLDTLGNLRIYNYTGNAIPENYQLYGQVAFVKKQ